MSLSLNSFDMSKLTGGQTIGVCARRKSGKSVLTRDIMYHVHRNIAAAVIICPTEMPHKPFYAKHIPPGYIYQNYSPTITAKIFARQKKVMKRHKKTPHIDPSLLFIMDDCAPSSKKWLRDPNIAAIFANGRHYRMMFILVLQDPMILEPFMRNNTDLVFLLKDNNRRNVRRIYNAYGTAFPDFDTFEDVFKACTQNYGCMVIDNSANSEDICDICYHYRADLHEGNDFKFGCRALWKYHKIAFNENYDEEQEVKVNNNDRKIRVNLK